MPREIQSSSPRASAGRLLGRATVGSAVLALLVAGIAFAVAADAGFRDQTYALAPGGDKVTVSHTQSKVWTNDGRWFAVMFDPVSTNAKYRIWRHDMASQTWTNTTVPVDDRNRARIDVLAAGSKLYVASTHRTDSVRFYRYTYDAATKTYVADAGFPKVIAGTTAGTGYGTIARDSTGRLWIAYPVKNPTVTNDVTIHVTTSSDSGATWDAPFALPQQGSPIRDDDVVTLSAFGPVGDRGIAAVWSDQHDADDAFFFSAHRDADPVGTWQPRETAFGSANSATAHEDISLREDPSGRLLAAVGTDRDSKAGTANDPLTAVLRRSGSPGTAGTWTVHTVSSVTTGGFRPVLAIDAAAGLVRVFQVHPERPEDGQQKVYQRTAPIDSLAFGTAALGTAVIANAADPAIDDPTTTRQIIGAGTGLVVLASDRSTRQYLHACVGGPCPVKPAAEFSATPTTGKAPLDVAFSDLSTGTPTSWTWNFGDGGTSTLRNPTHRYTTPGTYTVTLTVANVAGSDGETKTGYITVPPPPVAAFSASPTSGNVPLGVSFTDQSTNNPTSWSWSFGDGATSTSRNPSHTYNAAGQFTVSLTVTGPGGTNTLTKTNHITVNPNPSVTPPTAGFTASPLTGPAPLAVTFTDTSTGAPTAWSWTFGDGGTSLARNPTYTYTRPGTYTVTLKASNAGGFTTSTRTAYITVTDKSGPTIGPLVQRFVVRSTTGSTTSTRLAWSATDPSGVASYRLHISSDGGRTWARVALPRALSTSVGRSLVVGRQYHVRVTAYDRKGNVSRRTTPLKISRIQETSTAIRYSGTWRRAVTSLASGGALRYTTARNASATLTFTGKSVALIGWTGPRRGVMKVYVDGATTPVTTVDLRTATNLSRRLVFGRSWSASGTHTVRFVLTGTTGRWRLDVDGFLVGR